ncbi:MAG: acyltransferase family protein [Bacteroidales bacterium]|nr:acyltransferase family protein [Bacteroidales bacterium]MBP5518544.1 acyltransferase family protein [Bacteroidales bacterium]
MRKTYLDVIRIWACVLVILMHSPMNGTSGAIQNLVYALSGPCIGLFFMVSGALLLPCEGGWAFVKKRFYKVLAPTLIWTLFYILANILIKHQSVSSLWRQILSIPFSPQGHGILWFMYVLCGLYLLSPIISPWLKTASAKDVRILLCIWGITLLFPFLKPYLNIASSPSGGFYYFTGYAGYFLLGFYLTRFEIKISLRNTILLAFVAILIIAAVRFTHTAIDFNDAISYLSLPVVMLTISYFSAMEKIGKTIRSDSRTASVLEYLSGLSFGVYLVHIFFIRYLLWDFMPGGLKQILLTVAITLLLSFLASWLISLLPFSRYIIGFKKTKSKKL